MTPAFRAAIEAATKGLKSEYSRQIGHASNDGWLDEFVAKAAIRAFDAAVADIQRLRAEVARLKPPLPEGWGYVPAKRKLYDCDGEVSGLMDSDGFIHVFGETVENVRAIAAHFEGDAKGE